MRQGDPLGPLLFALGYCVALPATLAAHPDSDPVVSGRLVCARRVGEASPAAATFASECAKISLRVNVEKSVAYCASRNVSTLALPPVVTASPAGTTVLGTPVGMGEYFHTQARKRLFFFFFVSFFIFVFFN